ncbi:MAG: hypothetical protein IPK08_15065 [Bacteroidetes bacterium]|nr:hypothetical protein [Bacteroidota bacterium]
MFSIGTKGYVCAGDGANSLLATCYTYNSSINAWNSIASTPDNLDEAAAFSINGKGYIAGGQYTFWNGPNRNYLIQYDPIINSWTSKRICQLWADVEQPDVTSKEEVMLEQDC